MRLAACRSQTLQGQPTFEWPVAERGWGLITRILKRGVYLIDGGPDLGGDGRQCL